MSYGEEWFLADDLSGALEVGAVWRRAGHAVSIAETGRNLRSGDSIAGVSSETRNADPASAYISIKRILNEMNGARLSFKKIDSTMRGPVGAELRALAERVPGRPILFTPANPVAGRTVRDGGRLFVDGAPISESEFGTDPTAPVRWDRIGQLIGESGGPEVASLGSRDLASPLGQIAKRLLFLWGRSPVVVADASCEADLEKALLAARMTGRDFLPVGSGALAQAMVKTDPLRFRAKVEAAPPLAFSKGLFVVGSAHPRSREQLERAQSAGLRVAYLSMERYRNDADRENDCLYEAVSDGLRERGLAGLASALPGNRAEFQAKDARFIAGALGRLAAELIDGERVDFAFLTGGEIAHAVLRAAGWESLALMAEYEPGVALAELKRRNGKGLVVAVKPGGFGQAALVVKLSEHVNRAAGGLGGNKNNFHK